jgi:hypothetical protein
MCNGHPGIIGAGLPCVKRPDKPTPRILGRTRGVDRVTGEGYGIAGLSGGTDS